MDRLLGVKVNVTTILDNSVIGGVYSYCKVTNTLTLVEEDPEGKHVAPNYRVMKLSFIRDVSVIDKKNSASNANSRDTFANAEPKVGHLLLGDAIKRETAAVRNAQEARLIKGVGASVEGQRIFQALYKTLPCRWHEKSIIVMDEVRIDPPYTVESCRAKNEASSALALVQKMVAGAREKLGEVKGG